MQVTVVGAGCAGLTVACCLAKDGHKVTVLERNSSLSVAGGGISIRVGAARVLRQYGLIGALEEVARPFDATRIIDAHTGKLLRRMPNPSQDTELSCFRPDYQQAMFQQAKKLGVEVLFGRTVRRVVDVGDRPYLDLKDGTRLEADLLIAADGVRSRLREAILGKRIDPEVLPTAYYSVRIDDKVLGDRAETLSLVDNTDLHVYVGKDVYVVSRYAQNVGVWSALYGVKEERHGETLWEEHGDIQIARDFFAKAGASSALRAALESIDACDRWQLSELQDLPSWRSKTGRLVLLGDSAHAMQPNAAQGLSQSIEDAAVLSFLVTQTGVVRQATQLWQDLRKPRVENIKAFARTMTTTYMSGNREAWERRERQASNSRQDDDGPASPNARYGSRAYAQWLYDYDALLEAKKMLDSVDKAKL